MTLGLGWLLIGGEVDGIECHHRVADDTIPPDFFELQLIRNANGLKKLYRIQALRHGIRLLTLLKPDADADVESELLDDRHNS